MAFSTALYANDRQRSLLYAAGQPSIRPRKHIKSLCCDVVGYFADILSGTGLWATFLSRHRSLYGRTLPFFPAENYYNGEVNREDLRVLLWYLLCTHDSLHEILSPLDDRLVATADTIYDLLESEYETAPDSPLLQEFCLPELNDTDDPEARYRFAEWLFWDSFLLGPSNRSLARQLSHEAWRQRKNRQARRTASGIAIYSAGRTFGALCSRMGLFALATHLPRRSGREKGTAPLLPAIHPRNRRHACQIHRLLLGVGQISYRRDAMGRNRRRTSLAPRREKEFYSLCHALQRHAHRFGYSPMRMRPCQSLLRPAGSPKGCIVAPYRTRAMPHRPTHLFVRKPTASRCPLCRRRLCTCNRKLGLHRPLSFAGLLPGSINTAEFF